jgi:hypothetical protein
MNLGSSRQMRWPVATARALAVSLTVSLAVSLASSRPAAAIDRDVKAVLTAGEYGIAGGTILGLAAMPFARDARAIFIGSSLGLYLGAAVGIYYILHRNDPDNPLRLDDRQKYEDEGSGRYGGWTPAEEPRQPDQERKQLLGAVTVLRF